MGHNDLDLLVKKARPILNERDYQAAKELLERELRHSHDDRASERLEALMREVADYEARFLQGEEDDVSDLVQYAYSAALDEDEGPRRRWTDDDF